MCRDHYRMDHVMQNSGQTKSSPRSLRSGPSHGTGTVIPYGVGPHSNILSAPRSRDASPNRGVFGPLPNVPGPHYPMQPSHHTSSQGPHLPPPPPSQLSMTIRPPLSTQRMGLLPHPVFPPPIAPPPIVLPSSLPPSQGHIQFPPVAPPLLMPGELSGLASLTDITNTVSSLGFPASCNFVLGLLQSYFTTCLASADSKSKPPSQLTRDNLKTLADLFILCQSRLALDQRSRFKGPSASPLTPLEEMQLLLSLHGQLEDQQSMELHYCIFDAVFGGITVSMRSIPDGKFDILKKLTSFSMSVDSCSTLSCVSLWMKSCPSEATALAKALYHDFCVLLPNAFEPLLNVPAVSVHFAQQLVIVYTSLFPFYSGVGKHDKSESNSDSSQLNPPIRILKIISHWITTYPDLLYSQPLLDKDIFQLPVINSQPPDFHPGLRTGKFDSVSNGKSLLPGLIQWCVLAPLFPKYATKNEEDLKICVSEKKMEVSQIIATSQKDTLKAIRNLSLMEASESDSQGVLDGKTNIDSDMYKDDSKEDTLTLLASIHANLLSNMLSLAQPLPCQVSGDDIATVVAALLGYYSQRSQQEGEEEGSSLADKMDDCVERLAQILQICLSSGLTKLRPDDIVSIASTLPRNKLLELVISHAHQ